MCLTPIKTDQLYKKIASENKTELSLNQKQTIKIYLKISEQNNILASTMANDICEYLEISKQKNYANLVEIIVEFRRKN